MVWVAVWREYGVRVSGVCVWGRDALACGVGVGWVGTGVAVVAVCGVRWYGARRRWIDGAGGDRVGLFGWAVGSGGDCIVKRGAHWRRAGR